MKHQYNCNEAKGSGRRQTDRIIEDGGRLVRGLAVVAAAALAIAAVFAIVLTPSAAHAQRLVAFTNAQRTVTITVTVGKSEDIRTDQSFVDIMVGDPEVADVTPLTDHGLSVLGKKIGTTRVTVYGEGKKLIGIFDVEVSYDITRLATEIARFTGGGIKVSSVNGRVMLSGNSPDAVTLDKAVTMARQFAPEVINTVQVMQPQQVVLEVRFIEAGRQATRDLGVQWNMFGNSVLANVGNRTAASSLPTTSAGGSLNTAASVTAAGVLTTAASPFGFLVGRLVGGPNPIDVSLNALEVKGLIRNLAEPNLVALSGDTASFLAGGEYPVPVPGALGQIIIEYKKYGVGLAFTPTVLKDGLINMVIKPEVSQLDFAHPVTISSTSVPSLIVRRASTTVELRDGQSFMLGGLLQNNSQTAQQQMPWLGDVPVLGTLFRSSDYQKQETDLVIIVTPHIVRPLKPGDTIHTPLDNTLPANDVDFFLMGQAEVSPSLARLAVGALNRPYVGHVLDLPKKGATNVVSAKD